MSGLTIGLMGLDPTTLLILTRQGTASEKKHASRILPLLKRHHLLLVTLLLANAACMEALPLFLDRMMPSWAAIIVSVTLVLAFGEVIPQAICTRYGLAVGSSVHWLVWGLIIMTFPISWPISKLLDLILGTKHTTLYKRNQLKEFVTFHGSSRLQNSLVDDHDEDKAERLSYDEVLVIKGALDLSSKVVRDALTPLDKVFMLDCDTVLTDDILTKIAEVGHSRIPVFKKSRENIVGFVLIKQFVVLSRAKQQQLKVADLNPRNLPIVPSTTPLYHMLNSFQTGRSHIALVEEHGQKLGIITLEDIMEELIQEEIDDETDYSKKRRRLEKIVNSTKVDLAAEIKLDRRFSGQAPDVVNLLDTSDEDMYDADMTL